MWKSVVGHDVNVKVESEGDDWETDPNFEVSKPEYKRTSVSALNILLQTNGYEIILVYWFY